jgi:hypothetical protein
MLSAVGVSQPRPDPALAIMPHPTLTQIAGRNEEINEPQGSRTKPYMCDLPSRIHLTRSIERQFAETLSCSSAAVGLFAMHEGGPWNRGCGELERTDGAENKSSLIHGLPIFYHKLQSVVCNQLFASKGLL